MAFALLLAAVVAPAVSVAALSKIELKCSVQLSKAAQKLASTAYRELSRCRLGQVDGSITTDCPTQKALDKIQSAVAQVVAAAESSCGSQCSVSPLPCVSSDLCPPLGDDVELCTAGEENRPFEMEHLGFPGPYCELRLGRSLMTPPDIANCVAGLVQETSALAVGAVVGALPEDAQLSRDAEACLGAAVSGAGKLMRTIFRAAAKCRASVYKGKKLLNPTTCIDDDARLAAKVAKVEAKFRSLLGTRCTGMAVAELDPCGTGVGSTQSVSAAADCVIERAREAADGRAAPADRLVAPISLVEGAYPPAPRCGDNLVNQLPNPFLLVGEECDGTDDSACPGKCLPPGDLFECSCADVPRLRFFASSEGSETDAGWTGLSHDQLAADLSGFVVDLAGCDCSAFLGATCVGVTVDPICELHGETMPVCSHSPMSAQRCDDSGDQDGADENSDCYVCDEFTLNAGAHCLDEGDCQSRCYDSEGVGYGTCESQSDCGIGQACRGRCDKGEFCIRTPNGGPLPVNSAGASVCGVQTFRTDVTGTLNLVTGSHEIYYQLFSQIHTGEGTSRPCPVCGGFCVGGANDNKICSGTCSGSGDSCRFDDECPTGQQCTVTSPDCPGGHCELSLVCGTNAALNPEIEGKACRISAEHRFFGTVSNDCLPASSSNTTGRGLEIDYLPWTSGTLTLPATVPCTAPGFELYECPCPDDGGQPSKPNECAPACNAMGPAFGAGCADGNSSGKGTKCTGGPNDGRLCDEDADCPLGSCSGNPLHCIGDPAFERYSCTTNADCGFGACVDACPGGRCVPLCVPTASDPYDGECAAGPPTYHCAGLKFLFKSCSTDSVGAGCSSVCSGSSAPCVEQSDCPSGETCEGACPEARDCAAGPDGVAGTPDDLEGAGLCIEDIRSCFVDPIVAQGGSTLNGEGDATNMSTVGLFCQKRSVNIGANSGAGFGGPTRVRVRGTNVANFASIP